MLYFRRNEVQKINHINKGGLLLGVLTNREGDPGGAERDWSKESTRRRRRLIAETPDQHSHAIRS